MPTYGITLVTPPSGQVVSTAELKAHLRLNLTDEDALLTSYIAAATQIAQDWTGRQLLTASYTFSYDSWSCYIPKPPTRSITSIQYYDSADALQTWSDYTLDKTTEPARIVPTLTLPSLSSTKRPRVLVTVSAGYGTAADVPPDLVQAIRLMSASYYLLREGVIPTLGELLEPPYGIRMILQKYRVFI